MKLIPESINIAETNDIETLKNQISACIYIKLQEQDMDGFFGDFLRNVDVLEQTVRFYEFDQSGCGESDWNIMKECFVNAASLDTIVNYKYAVWRENEGWRCVSGRDSGLEYLWDFFQSEQKILRDVAQGIIHKTYNDEKLTIYEQRIILYFFARFEDLNQIFAKVEELRSMK
jgi:hypothetical protein